MKLGRKFMLFVIMVLLAVATIIFVAKANPDVIAICLTICFAIFTAGNIMEHKYDKKERAVVEHK